VEKRLVPKILEVYNPVFTLSTQPVPCWQFVRYTVHLISVSEEKKKKTRASLKCIPTDLGEMKILCIDTSSSAGSVVLVCEEGVRGELYVDSTQTHSARLLSGIDSVLTSASLTIGDVDGFAVISGPGSFTGIRIGLTTVKGLADSLRKPALPITSFEAWVEKHHDLQGILVPLIPARRGEVYACVYERQGSELRVLSDGIVGDVASVISQISEAEVSFIGDGANQNREIIKGSGRKHWNILVTDLFLGQAMARIACRRAIRNEFCSAHDLAAFYLRQSDAEIHWKEK
jgi:tRNA threonylcarbamoyladenosine biosynthesis protein TsaB